MTKCCLAEFELFPGFIALKLPPTVDSATLSLQVESVTMPKRAAISALVLRSVSFSQTGL